MKRGRMPVASNQASEVAFESGDTAFWAYLLECLDRLGLDLRLVGLRPSLRLVLFYIYVAVILLIGLVWMTRPVRSKTPMDAGGAH